MNITVRLPVATVERADDLAARVIMSPPRGEVLRHAVERGLDALEAELSRNAAK